MIDAVSTFCFAPVNLSSSHFEKFVVKLILGCLTIVASFLLSFKDSGRVYQSMTKETATTTSLVVAESNCFVELLEHAKEDL